MVSLNEKHSAIIYENEALPYKNTFILKRILLHKNENKISQFICNCPNQD